MAKNEAKIISKPEATAATTNSNSNSDVIISSNSPATPIVTSLSGNDKNNVSQDKNKDSRVQQDLTETVTTKRPNRHIIPPKIGLYNRTNYNLHVIFKKEDILFPPRKRTEKIYKESEIVSVQGKPLQSAVAEGLISIIR